MRSSSAHSRREVRPSSAHWDRELAVEVQQRPLGAGEEELAKTSWRGGAGKEEDEEDEKEKEEEKSSVKT